MSDLQHTLSKKLFELLDFCGIRQRDIVVRLGVSKALVSLWRSGHREISPDHYIALLQFASVVFLNGIKALVYRASDHTPETTEEAFAVFEVFIAKMQAANAERDPTPVYNRLLISMVMLHATLHHKGEPATWDEDTIEFVAAEGQHIANMAKLLQSQIAASKAATAFQAQTTTTLHALLSTLQETPYATAHDSGQCASQPDPGPGGLRPPPAPGAHQEGLRAPAGDAAAGL